MTESPSELQSEIQKLERKHQENPQGRYFVPLANAYRKLGELERAESLLREGLQKHPEYLSAHIVLGRCLADRNATREAADEFRYVLSVDAQNLIALRTLGELAVAEGKTQEAERWFQELVAVDPMNEEAQRALTSLTGVAPEPDAAVAVAPEDFQAGAGWWQAPAEGGAGPEGAPSAADAGTAEGPAAADEIPDLQLVPPSGFDTGEDWLQRGSAHDSPTVEPEADEAESETLAEVEARAPVRGGGGYQEFVALDEPVPALDQPAGGAPAGGAARGAERVVDPPAAASPPPVPAEDTPAAEEPEDEVGAVEVVTATIAELYARQGLYERSAEVYRELIRRRGGDEAMERRLSEIEALAAGGTGAAAPEEPVEATEPLPGLAAAEPAEAPAGPGAESLPMLETNAHADGDPDAFAVSFARGFGPAEEPVATAMEAEPLPLVESARPAGGPRIGAYLAALAAWRPGSGEPAEPAADGTPAGTISADEEPFPWELPPAGAGEGPSAPEPISGADEAVAVPEPHPTPGAPAASADQEDDDLESFQAWLRSLKR